MRFLSKYFTDAGLNWMSFGARQYDPQIGRFLSVDPLAAAGGQDMLSPYHAMGNNPTNVVDPGGMIPPPIGDQGGPKTGMLGLNNIPPVNPLAIIASMFSPGTIAWLFGGDPAATPFGVQDWGSSGSTGVSQGVWQNAAGIEFSINGMTVSIPGIICNLGPKGDGGPDNGNGGEEKYNFGQGIYTGDNLFLEAYENYQTGLGRDFHVDVSILDFSNVKISDLSFNSKKGTYSFDFYKANRNSQEALTLGKIELVKIGRNEFNILPDKYDFNIEMEKGFSNRNIATFGANILHHLRNPLIPLIFGGSFWIKFHGSVTINP